MEQNLFEHLPELVKLQSENGVSLLYEASACASIPIIRNLEEYYDNELLYSLRASTDGIGAAMCDLWRVRRP